MALSTLPRAQAARHGGALLRLTYDAAAYEQAMPIYIYNAYIYHVNFAYEQAVREAENQQRALAAAAAPPPRKEVYVKGAMEWERQAWRVWDVRKAPEEPRRAFPLSLSLPLPLSRHVMEWPHDIHSVGMGTQAAEEKRLP